MERGKPALKDYEALFESMLQGKLCSAELAGVLVALRLLGEDATLLTAGASVMRRHSVQPASKSWQTLRPITDNCGTGGDGADSFNISTAAALVASSCGVRLAKHGNRSVSSRCGSADLLFAAGLPDNLDVQANLKLLKETGFTFFFAPQFHPMMAHVMPVRRALKIPSVFNLLGPLANPLQPDYQLIGVSHHGYLEPMATALVNLGVKRGMVVTSEDGLDEISPAAPTKAMLIENKLISEVAIDPLEFGVTGSLQDLAGGDPETNLILLKQILKGEISVLSKTVCLNAAAVIWISQQADDMKEAYQKAVDKLRSGEVATHLASILEAAKDLAANEK